MIIEEQFREAAHVAKTKMSLAAVAKLKAINERDRAVKSANAVFAETFNRLPHDCKTLQAVISRCSGTDQDDLERRAIKLKRMLTSGERVTEPFDVICLSNLSAEEQSLSDVKFLAAMEIPADKTSAARAADKPTYNGYRCPYCNTRLTGKATKVCQSLNCLAVHSRSKLASSKKSVFDPSGTRINKGFPGVGGSPVLTHMDLFPPTHAV
jgi:hypothetical protein